MQNERQTLKTLRNIVGCVNFSVDPDSPTSKI